MSWKLTLIAVRAATVDDLAAAGWVLDGPPIVGELAIEEEDQLHGRQIGDDVLLVGGPFGPHLLDEVDEKIAHALQTEVVAASFFGTTDSYWWRVHSPSLSRNLLSTQGEAEQDSGEPLSEEAGHDELTEDVLFELFEARTGISFDDWFQEETLRLQDGSSELPADEDRGLLGRLLRRVGLAR